MTDTAAHDTTRLEAFSDAIFGFAATLLVVSLDVPTSYTALVDSLKGFVAFGLSFVALVRIWYTHREFFKRFPISDKRTVQLNTALLFVVLFFVYPLKFLMRTMVMFLSGGRLSGSSAGMMMQRSDLAGMFIIFGLGWAAVFACFAAMYFHASKRADNEDDAQYARGRGGHYGIIAAVGLVSVVLAKMNVGIQLGGPGLAYLVMGPTLGAYWSWRRKSIKQTVT